MEGKRIIHVVQHLAPGGLETLTLDLLRLANPQDQVLIVSLEGTKDQAIENWPKLEPIQKQLIFLNKQPGVQFSILLTLIKAFKGVKPDVVHTHHIGPLLYAGYAARIAGITTRIHTEHDAWHLKNSKRRYLQSLALQAARPTLVADATIVYQQLRASFNYRNILTIKNGIDCDKFQPLSKATARQHFNLPSDKFIIGCAGRLEHVKGQDQLIKALSFLPKNSLLALAGHGSQFEKLQQLVSKLKLNERVVFLGLVDDMPSFYNSLDLFCLPSRHEGLPLSSLEAQACGIPTVGMDVGAVNESLCPNTGFLVQAGNIPHLAHALLKNIALHHKSNPPSPRQFVIAHYNITHMVESYNNISEGVHA